MFSVFVLIYQQLWGLLVYNRWIWDLYHATTDGFGIFTMHTNLGGGRGVRHKQVCTRVDSEGQKNRPSPCPTRGSNPRSSDFNSDTLTTESGPPSNAPCHDVKYCCVLSGPPYRVWTRRCTRRSTWNIWPRGWPTPGWSTTAPRSTPPARVDSPHGNSQMISGLGWLGYKTR